MSGSPSEPSQASGPAEVSQLALVRTPGPQIAACELTHVGRTPIDVEVARSQHERYVVALRDLGVDARVLPPLDACPDAVFVEDTAVVLPEVAVLCRPGVESRRHEVEAIAGVLAEYRPTVPIEAPGTLEGGDVLRIGRELFVGRSSRSNAAGIRQLEEAVSSYGYRVQGVEMEGCLHLKTAVTQVASDAIVLNPRWVDRRVFPVSRAIEVDPGEPMAANALWVRGAVIYDEAWVRTADRLRSAGMRVVGVDNQELAKAEGGVTCGALLIDT